VIDLGELYFSVSNAKCEKYFLEAKNIMKKHRQQSSVAYILDGLAEFYLKIEKFSDAKISYQ
jgi:hypothetical protein